jgi:multidrug resistance efflux pump
VEIWSSKEQSHPSRVEGQFSFPGLRLEVQKAYMGGPHMLQNLGEMVLKNKKITIILLAVMVLTLFGVSLYYWYNSTHYVTTEDARVSGDIIQISPQVTGRLVEVNVEEGDGVSAGQVMARLDDDMLPPGTNIDLTLVRAPRSGVVIQRRGEAGEIAAPGLPVFSVVDPEALYITANIEEDRVARVHPGQPVDIFLDNIPGIKFTGRVKYIGRAALSTFSLLPAVDTGGNFTKVVQRVPVKVVVDDFRGYQPVYGSNAVVRIRIR